MNELTDFRLIALMTLCVMVGALIGMVLISMLVAADEEEAMGLRLHQVSSGPVIMSKSLTFSEFRSANVARCLKWHPDGIESWSSSDWMTAIVGELGELASLIKMRNRERDGLTGNKFTPTDEMIAKEAADVYTYLDLFCEANGIDLGRAVVDKFNEVSERVGFPDRIEVVETPIIITDEMVKKAAMELFRIAVSHGVSDEDCVWAIHSEQFKSDARAALYAAHDIKASALWA